MNFIVRVIINIGILIAAYWLWRLFEYLIHRYGCWRNRKWWEENRHS